MKETEEEANQGLETDLEQLSIKPNDHQKISNSIRSIKLHPNLYSEGLITSLQELEKKLENHSDEILKHCEKVLECIEVDLTIKYDLDYQLRLKSLVCLIDGLREVFGLWFDDQDGFGLDQEIRVMLVFKLSVWYSFEENQEVWKIDEVTRQLLKKTIDKLWKKERNEQKEVQDSSVEIGRKILLKYIKPIFNELDEPRVSKQINLRTGRKKPIRSNGFQDELFGSNAGIGNTPKFKSHEFWGFWNSICLVINRFSSIKEFESIWDLLIPPIFNLLEDYEPTYKLKGLIISSELLQNVPIQLLSRTGIDSVLQNSFNQLYSSLKVSESYQILTITLRNHLNLIQSLHQHSIIDRLTHYNSLTDLFSKSIATPIHYNQSFNEPETHKFILESLETFVGLLGISFLRFHQLVLPYLMNVLTNFKVCLLELRCIGIGLRVLDRVLEFELIRDWKIRIGLVCLVSWIEFKQVYKKKVTEVEIHQIKSVYSLVVKKCLVKEINYQTDHQKKKPFRLIDEILMIDESLMELFL